MLPKNERICLCYGYKFKFSQHMEETSALGLSRLFCSIMPTTTNILELSIIWPDKNYDKPRIEH